VPTASVIIPNYNNGRASSRDGSRDFLGDLLANLERTLADDPTDLEIVVADDGSTDDSLETARAWASHRWPAGSPRAGRPFLRLVELPHSGVLSRVLNALHAQSSGEFILRLDGDILVDTPRWVEACVALLRSDPRAGVVTGLQKLPDGRVHAFGDAIVSPLGYHHLGQGAREEDLPELLEVEHAMGCFHASRRAAIAEAGGYDETVLRGQTEELAMRLNLLGWKAFATKRVVFRHFHAERHWRPNRADTSEGLSKSLARFREKHGIDRLAPDLGEAWRRYGATPLAARASLRAPRPWSPEATGEPAAGEEWANFASDATLQARIAAEVAAMRVAGGSTADGPTVVLGARSGLAAFLRAREGATVVAVEEHLPSVEAGRSFLARAGTGTGRLDLVHAPSLDATGLPSGGARVVTLLDSIERTWNPVALVRESMRLLAADGMLVIRARARTEPLERRGEALHPFAAHELLQIARHVGGLEPLSVPTLDGLGRWCLVARLADSAGHDVHFGAPPIAGPPQ
jgi:glycosyltransferase involved in cell wall biosynthesis